MKIAVGCWDTRHLAKGITQKFADLSFYWTKTTGDTLVNEIADLSISISSCAISSPNINTIISQSKTEDVDFLLIVPSGTLFLNPTLTAKGLYEFVKQEPVLAGHIIDHSKKNTALQSFFGLHEQCVMLSKTLINDIVNDNFQITESFDYTDQSWPIIERSDENMHDDYTPLWIKKLTTDVVNISKTNSEFCLFHDLIKFAINKNYTIHNLPNNLRNSRAYSYQLTNPSELEALVNKPLSEINKLENVVQGHKEFLVKWKSLLNAEQGFWAYNTEPVSAENVNVDCFVAVASGIIPWVYLSNFKLAPGSNIYFIDVNTHCLDFQKYFFENINNFNDYDSLVSAFSIKNNLSKFGSKSQKVNEDEYFNIIKSKWDIIKTCNIHYLQGNIIYLPTEVKDAIEKSSSPYLWFSNVLRYIPTIDNVYRDDDLQAYLTDLLRRNLKLQWAGSATHNHKTYGPNGPIIVQEQFYKTLDNKLPYADFLDEIETLEKLNLFTPHREENSVKGVSLHKGWSSFVLHGLGYNKTEGYEVYGYANNEDAPYDWTAEALEHCPKLVTWFKEKKFKDKYHRVRIMKLAPGGMVGLHSDNPNPDTWATNMAINNPEECEMHFWDKNWQYLGQVPWMPGDTNRIRIGYYHVVINKSNKARYHMITHGEGGWM